MTPAPIDYYFGWDNDGKVAAIVFPFGSLYNHSSSPSPVRDAGMAISSQRIASDPLHVGMAL
jgi:hypothetical protein